ncbi:hypothetical protein HPB48_021711 [Haemaphysalis longicornis]|uniref:Uncharacterized protein n=1 Tax=Haemaphysalis longicornis TaxID=44386 RepID=A0A9J6GKK9_HAELO|nr:hypothetical protein HPB48_021711 [Haemaphysalis longicornis]
MDVVAVEGELISHEDFSSKEGWITSHRREGVKAVEKLGQSLEQDDAGFPKSAGQQRAPQASDVPKEDLKIVLRPCDSLDCARCSEALKKDGVLRAANFKAEEVDKDTLRVSTLRNILVVSTPSSERAATYSKTESLTIRDKIDGVVAYVRPPEECAKGIIYNIPATDSEEDMLKSLVKSRNLTVLQARRLGKSNTTDIVFEGEESSTLFTIEGRNTAVTFIGRKTKCASRADASVTDSTCVQ